MSRGDQRERDRAKNQAKQEQKQKQQGKVWLTFLGTKACFSSLRDNFC
jgi:hypothetical protein